MDFFLIHSSRIAKISPQILRVGSGEERMYTSSGYKFNIPVVAKIRLFYEELLDKMSPVSIVSRQIISAMMI